LGGYFEQLGLGPVGLGLGLTHVLNRRRQTLLHLTDRADERTDERTDEQTNGLKAKIEHVD
jgi:hypothetical protein